jgi:murein DD-endopeptidase MepM/ murein hydrolase activator NlpD
MRSASVPPFEREPERPVDMRRHRTTAKRFAQDRNPRVRIPVARTSLKAAASRPRGIVVSLLTAGLLAAAASPAGGGGNATEGVPRLVFPLVAKTELWDNYGDPRGNGRHAGIDMENPWRAPVVAVEAGQVKYWQSSLGGCMLYLYGKSGTTYMYIHLNDDLTPRGDNRGGCKKDVSYAVSNHSRVTAGQQIGFNGDSGDAVGNHHLHFEVHPGGGGDVNPYRHLQRAVKPLFAAKLGARFSLGLRGDVATVGEGTVQLDVDQVRHYPGGRWLTIDRRRVELAVAPDAVVAPSLTLLAGTERRQPRGAVPVVAYTAKAKTTLGAITGRTGMLTAGRIEPSR